MICTHKSTDLFVLKLIQLHKKKVDMATMIPTWIKERVLYDKN